MRTLILGLGNDLLGDDAVGLLAARELRRDRALPAEVKESSQSGLYLLDLFLGYDRAVILDAVQTGRHAPGTILELAPEDLSPAAAPSPHYAGLPEMFALARSLSLPFPGEVRILAVEAADPYTVGGEVSAAVRAAAPEVCRRVRRLLGIPPRSSRQST